jgi:hypothetical protein
MAGRDRLADPAAYAAWARLVDRHPDRPQKNID